MKKILIMALAVLAVFIFIKNKNSINADKNLKGVSAKAEEKELAQDVQSFSISGFSDNGKSNWQVEGESADIFSDIVNMHVIKAKSRGEEVSVVLTADEGTFFKENKDVELRKNVVAITDEGTTLKTEKLNWLAATEEIITDENVYIYRKDMDLYGIGAKATPNMKKLFLEKNVKMLVSSANGGFISGLGLSENAAPEGKETAQVNEKSITIITCEGPLEVDYQNNISYFRNNVIIEDKNGKIFADTVMVYINPEEKRIHKAKAKGNVKIEHGQNISYSDEAIYLTQEQKAILIGRPKVLIYSVSDKNKQAQQVL